MMKTIGIAVVVLSVTTTGLCCEQGLGIRWALLLDYLGRAHVESEYVVATGYLCCQPVIWQPDQDYGLTRSNTGPGIGSGLGKSSCRLDVAGRTFVGLGTAQRVFIGGNAKTSRH